jgi:hypothetical protein
VEEIKTSSSKWIKTKGRALANFRWQIGYGGFSVSPADVEKLAEFCLYGLTCKLLSSHLHTIRLFSAYYSPRSQQDVPGAVI